MFGPSITTVFASRWKALMWAAGILLTAYCSIPSQEETAAAAMPSAPVHTNPWAKNAPAAPPTNTPKPTPDFADDQGLRDVEAMTRKLSQ